jgi:hypothetical protein
LYQKVAGDLGDINDAIAPKAQELNAMFAPLYQSRDNLRFIAMKPDVRGLRASPSKITSQVKELGPDFTSYMQNAPVPPELLQQFHQGALQTQKPIFAPLNTANPELETQLAQQKNALRQAQNTISQTKAQMPVKPQLPNEVSDFLNKNDQVDKAAQYEAAQQAMSIKPRAQDQSLASNMFNRVPAATTIGSGVGGLVGGAPGVALGGAIGGAVDFAKGEITHAATNPAQAIWKLAKSEQAATQAMNAFKNLPRDVASNMSAILNGPPSPAQGLIVNALSRNWPADQLSKLVTDQVNRKK